MMWYRKGDKARSGYYLNLSGGELVHIDKDGVIPTTSEGRFTRIPSLVAALGVPFVGLAYVVFLPLIGIIATTVYAGLKFRKTA